MPKISELPDLSLSAIYYEGDCLLVANGTGDNGEYITGVINYVDLINAYLHTVETCHPEESAIFLYASMLGEDPADGYDMYGVEMTDMTNTIGSYLSTDSDYNDYLSSFISDCISDYLSANLSEYMSNYLSEYVENMPSQSYDSEDITGIAVRLRNSPHQLGYVECSQFVDVVNLCLYYQGGWYDSSLSDNTPIAALRYSDPWSDPGYQNIAPISLGDIVSYVKAHL